METAENRKRFTHRSQSLCLPSFSSLAFSLYREKCSFLLQERAVTVMGRAQYVNTAQKNERHIGDFILKKAPKRNIKEAQHHAV